MIPESIEGGGRHGVDGVGADQFLDVHHIAVGGIFRAGAGPEHALCLCAFGCERIPAWSGEDLLVGLYVSLALAIAILPSSDCSFALRAGSVSFLICSFNSESISVSMRLIKKLATLATRLTSPPPAANVSRR